MKEASDRENAPTISDRIARLLTFLPAMGLAFPFRVRALFFVRWPRTCGKGGTTRQQTSGMLTA